MDTKYIIALSSLLLLLTGCEYSSNKSTSPQVIEKPKSLDSTVLTENIGWIQGKCLAIKNAKLKPGADVQVIVLSIPQKILNAKVAGVAVSSSECPALLQDRVAINKQEARFFYNLDIGKEYQDMMAVGLVSLAVTTRKAGPVVEVDLNKDGIAEKAGYCVTSEGVQFYISSSNVFDAEALWSDYYYLGYDTTPTCP